MTKSFNRAQGKAYREERQQRERDEDHKKNVRAELKVPGDFRHYMQRERPTHTTLGCLIAAVDAYAEQLTGDMHALWAGSANTKHCGMSDPSRRQAAINLPVLTCLRSTRKEERI